MSATAAQISPRSPDAAQSTLVRLIRAIRSEATKLGTLRLSLCTALGTVVLTVGLSWGLTALISAAHRANRPEEAAGLETGSAFMVIVHYGQIGVILLGAWLMHQEAEPGSLRSTLISTPQRGMVFTAKALVLIVSTGIVAFASVWGAAGVRCLVADCSRAENMFGASPADQTRILLGAVLYWVLIALFTYGLAAALRSALAAMGITLALVLIVSTYLLNVSSLARFLPDQAGAQLYQSAPFATDDPGAFAGGLILLAWVVCVMTVGLVLFRRQPIRN